LAFQYELLCIRRLLYFFNGDIISCVPSQALDNLKAKAKKALGNDKVELAKTGGGTFVRQLSELDMKVIALLGHTATPLKNPFDADASYNKETGYLTICTCEN